MRLVKRIALILASFVVLPFSLSAQELGSINKLGQQSRQPGPVEVAEASEKVRSQNSDSPRTSREQLYALLNEKINVLRSYRSETADILSRAEKDAVDYLIKRLNERLTELERDSPQHGGTSLPPTDSHSGTLQVPVPPLASSEERQLSSFIENDVNFPTSAMTGRSSVTQELRFLLSYPGSGQTDIPTEDFELSWTRATWAKSFTVEVREDRAFGTTGDVIKEIVTRRTSYEVPKDKLRPGAKYYWRVTAECDSSLAACPQTGTVVAADAPYSFSTIRKLGFFSYLSDKRFSLRRVVSGDAESEGATFSFLRTLGAKTVYTADFAFIWDSKEAGERARYSLQLSLEGHLTSDESKAEDALRFGSGLAVKNRFGSSGLNGLHSTLSAKLETDQRFTTKKVYFEALETPTAINYYIGRFSGEVGDPVQFRWRPFFGFQIGHTLKQGKSLPEDTLLRVIPRARLEFKLNFISQALKIPRTLLFAEDTFYFLPLEEKMRKTNFRESGIEFDFTPNFGLSFNYKNGRAAPKFERINTFGGAFTIRFDKTE